MTATPPPVRRRRRRPLLWVGLPLLLVIAVVAVFFVTRGDARTKRGIGSDDIDIRMGKSEIADVQVAVNEVGTIEPVVKVDVKSTLSGKVTELLVREGDKVTRGQVLARVEPDVNQAQTLAAVRSEANLAEIRAADARKHLETNERLQQEGY